MAKKDTTLFSYKDKDGVDVIVDRLEDVPQEYRGKMKVMTLDGIAHDVTPQATAAPPAPTTKQLPGLDLSSVAAGAAGGLFVGVLAGMVMGKLGGRGRLFGMVLTFAVMVGIMGLYFNFARQQMGLANASPKTMIDNTQATKELIHNTHEEKMKALNAIEKSEK
jgi:hypothetical protein